jgi:hypothetical protein
MRERVRADEGVRLARPRVQRLSAAMEREATALLAALLADAAKHRGVPIGGPVGGPIGTPIATPKNEYHEGGGSPVAKRDRAVLAESDNRGRKTS